MMLKDETTMRIQSHDRQISTIKETSPEIHTRRDRERQILPSFAAYAHEFGRLAYLNLGTAAKNHANTHTRQITRN